MKKKVSEKQKGDSMIRQFEKSDIEVMKIIYNCYIRHSVATFDIEPYTLEEMEGKMRTIIDNFPAYVYEMGGEILGFCYASSFRNKPAYVHTAEVTVYLKEGESSKGIGGALYGALIPELKARKFRTLTSLITNPNEASVRLHEKFGFKQKCIMEKIGYKFDKWLDVIYMECQLY